MEKDEIKIYDYVLYMKSGNIIKMRGNITFSRNSFGQLYQFAVKDAEVMDKIPLWISLSEVEAILITPIEKVDK